MLGTLAAWVYHQIGVGPAATGRPATLTHYGSPPFPRCRACGRSLARGGNIVELHGAPYHETCALYRPRRARS